MSIVVVGSINVDDIYKAASLPVAGETVAGATYQQQGGGKGANQAVAAAFDDQPVRMIGRVGPDSAGEEQVAALEAMGVNCAGVTVGRAATGRAAVLIGGGENQIVVASGANRELSPALVRKGFEGISGGVVLISAEIPRTAMGAAAAYGLALGMTIVVNAAPARPLPSEITDNPHLLVVNEIEAQVVSSPTQVTTLGARGVRIAEPNTEPVLIAALEAPQVVDSTGAGDAFCGVFAASLDAGFDIGQSVKRANAAASAAVRVVGARTWRTVALPDDVVAVLGAGTQATQ